MWASEPTFPSLVPNLPNLCFEVGKREAAPIAGVPNLPNLPNLFLSKPSRVYARSRAHVRMENTNIGWEGWEGWEEAVGERLKSSQPQNRGWEGWEAQVIKGAEMVDRNEMRRRFDQAAAWCGWSAEDRKDISLAILAAWKALEAEKDGSPAYMAALGVLQAWAAWLNNLAGMPLFSVRCRSFEARVRAERAEERKAP